jgi:hypothetical protein
MLWPQLKEVMVDKENPETLSLAIKLEDKFSVRFPRIVFTFLQFKIEEIFPKWKGSIISEKNLSKLYDVLKVFYRVYYGIDILGIY